MDRSHRRSRGKLIRPTFFVFCEGETEEAYICYLRNRYRVPIEIKTKVAKNNISQQYVKRILKLHQKHIKDQYFLLYDLDVPEMLSRLQSIKNTVLLVSNPCIELWFILHICNHNYPATSLQCIGQLERICRDYKKGSISHSLKNKLLSGEDSACSKAKKLSLYENPYTNVYLLIEALKSI